MMDGVIGTCSQCGGAVIGHVGGWWSVVPPPPPRCQSCGGVVPSRPVIKTVPDVGGGSVSSSPSTGGIGVHVTERVRLRSID